MLQVARVTALLRRDSTRSALAGLFYLCLVATVGLAPSAASALQIHHVYEFDADLLQRSETTEKAAFAIFERRSLGGLSFSFDIKSSL